MRNVVCSNVIWCKNTYHLSHTKFEREMHNSFWPNFHLTQNNLQFAISLKILCHSLQKIIFMLSTSHKCIWQYLYKTHKLFVTSKMHAFLKFILLFRSFNVAGKIAWKKLFNRFILFYYCQLMQILDRNRSYIVIQKIFH